MIVNPGIRRFLGSAIQRLFNSASFYAPLTHTLALERGTGSPTFTRASTATVTNNDGYLVTALAGEARFVGARRVRNLLTFTEDFSNAAWTKAGVTATAGQLTEDGTTGVHRTHQPLAGGATFAIGTRLLVQVELKQEGRRYVQLTVSNPPFGATSNAMFDLQSGVVSSTGAGSSATITATSGGYYRCTLLSNAASSAAVSSVFINPSNDGTNVSYTGSNGLVSISVRKAQVEDVTAQTTQTAGEYVSVGVESAPYYHGSMVDGVKCFPTDLEYYPTNLLTKSQELSDAVTWNTSNAIVTANQTTAPDGTLTADLYTAAANAQQTVWYAPSITTAAVFAYSLHIKAGTASWINLNLWDGAGSPGGIQGWFNVATGAVGSLTASAGFTAYSSDSEDLGDGWFRISVIGRTTGTIYPAFRVTDSDGSNASTATNGKTVYLWGAQLEQSGRVTTYIPTTTTAVTSTTLEGGNALTTMLGYLAEGARTNLCLQSNAFTTTWIAIGTPAATQNAVGPDGGTTAWTLTDNDAGSSEYVYQNVVLTAAAYTLSVFVKKTTGAQASYPAIYANTGTTIALATIDTSNGVATAWSAYTGLTMLTGISARCNSHNADYWRVELTYTGTAATYGHYLLPAGTANATQSTGIIDAAAQGSAVFYGAQVELGSFASSYIATTTAAVTRNADVLTYPSVGNVSGSAGWAYFEVTADWSANSGASAIGLGTGSVAIVYMDGTNISFYDGVNADVEGAYVPSAGDKVCVTWGGTTSSIAVNGTVLASGTFTAFTPDATIAIGGRTTGLSQWGGNEKNVRIGQRQLSASEMQAITA